MNIDWFEDDSGFADCCLSGKVFFYDLQIPQDQLLRVPDTDFSRTKSQITSIVNVPGSTNRALVASSERKIWDSNDHNNGCETRY